jgi:hypothetical protein
MQVILFVTAAVIGSPHSTAFALDVANEDAIATSRSASSRSGVANEESINSSEKSKYVKLDYESSGCSAVGMQEIHTLEDCQMAVQKLGHLKTSWNGSDADMPRGCTIKALEDDNLHMNWNTADFGHARSDLVPLCLAQANSAQPAQCAAEGKTCTCNGEVKYGFGAKWSSWKTVTSKIQCSNKVFGDPFPGQKKACLCKAAAAAKVSPEASKKIKMVIDTLKDIRQSIANEEKVETDLYNKHTAWCKKESANVAEALENGKKNLANAKVLSEEQVSSIESLKRTIAKNKKALEETSDSLEQAAALRKDENEKYTEELLVNTNSQRQIDAAIKHVTKIGKQGGFLQNGIVRKLQLNQPGESSYVLGVMKGLKDKLVYNANLLKKTEQDKVKMYDEFVATKQKNAKGPHRRDIGKEYPPL